MTKTTQPANLSNWRDAPFSGWAFHHVRDILPVADIAAGAGEPWALPSTPRSLEDFQLPAADGTVLDLDRFLKATATDGLVVLQGGKIVYEVYDRGTQTHTPHIIMSSTKAMTGLVAGILRGRGELNVDALVTDYLPRLASTAYRGATLRQLMDMRTGTVLDEAQQRAYDNASNWDPLAPGETPIDFKTFFETLDATHHDHGGPFAYISANTDLLGLLMEQATGKRFPDLVSELLWKPVGAEEDAYITVDRAGAARCTGGLCATVRDFARIGQLVAQSGRRDGAQIVPADWIEDLEAGGDADAWSRGQFAPAFPGMPMRYRAGWYVIDGEPKTLFAMGIHGQNLFVDRANNLVVAKLSSQAERFDYAANLLTHRAFLELRRCLVGR